MASRAQHAAVAADTSDALLAGLRGAAREAQESGIVEVFNYGRGRPGLIPLWVGEGDLPTPQFICDAATRSLAAGETFYTYQRGLPPLRQALADYHTRHFDRPFEPERFFVTGSGMQAMQIAVQALAGEGDEVIVPTPAWPNFAASVGIIGGRPVCVPMAFAPDGWRLDLNRLFDAASPRCRAMFINSPCNPSGWTADQDTLRAILNFARERGIWIIADEVYHRFFYDGARAPSFYDIMEEEDRIVFVNTFSKNWAMTGWRIGWIGAHPALGQVIENLVQYNTSGVATFMQRAATVALNEGEAFVELQVERARQGRAVVCDALGSHPRIRIARPDGAFYVLFAVDGYADTGTLGLRLVDEANIGVAPGTAFGPGGEAFMRICFARAADSLSEAMDRLLEWLKTT